MWEGLTKKWGRKNKKKQKFFPECQGRHSGKNFFLKSFNGVGGVDRQVTCFFAECRSSPSVALGEDGLCRVLLFTECQDLCGTRESFSSPSAILPRVQHSGKILFSECPICGTRESQRHSGNFASPVVKGPCPAKSVKSNLLVFQILLPKKLLPNPSSSI